ncbi:LTA synthase family protein [Aureibacillus halotolerans]|uniref:Phosphoglycerol transferase MdoB-like AlkP superfamily enzyme n=1 Tax=Aureibacillus halotolerans TaxID=1508390 RepID=A0A4R6U628_9BACI|nr:LTA synthase family protein [Aureibacillus halotolerans]TDQ41691.1 phosphoglycerol transferase MdoB-like AlkP superfamily enzyme [Aureibacillus halotolerans]
MKERFASSKYFVLLFTVGLLWIKTYALYRMEFSIEMNSLLEQFNLLINPLATLLLIVGTAFLFTSKRRRGWLLFVSIAYTLVLYANVLYFRAFSDFITIPVLLMTNNAADLGSSFFALLHIYDVLFFADVAVIAWLLYKKKVNVSFVFKKPDLRKYYAIVASVFIFNLALAEMQMPWLLTKTFDREIMVKNLGTVNYHVHDAFMSSKTLMQRAFANGSELDEITNYVNANDVDPSEDMQGMIEGKNVVYISMESMHRFVINKKVNGEEVTPFLNDLIQDSLYFSNFYSQVGQGKTSDSEFLVENSLYPLPRGSAFVTHADNQFRAVPEIVGEHGYHSAVFHANDATFWNRNIVYDSLGYDEFFDIESYDVNENNQVGWGLKDVDFVEQTVPYLKEMQQPFYTKLITLTNHFPFELDPQDQLIDPLETSSETVNNYFPTVRYTDKAIETFIQKMKDADLYENTVFILYGDHYGIPEFNYNGLEDLRGEEITPFDHVKLQRVPLIIHIPGYTDNRTIDNVTGQIDLKPTLLNMMGIANDDLSFGHDIFSDENQPLTILRDGSFITDEVLYTKGVCYDAESGEEIEASHCEPYSKKVEQELSYSDKIIYGDLLRFKDE